MPTGFDSSVSRPIGDRSLSYTHVISELTMVTDDVLAFTHAHFSTADACSFNVYCLRVDVFPISPFVTYLEYK